MSAELTNDEQRYLDRLGAYLFKYASGSTSKTREALRMRIRSLFRQGDLDRLLVYEKLEPADGMDPFWLNPLVVYHVDYAIDYLVEIGNERPSEVLTPEVIAAFVRVSQSLPFKAPAIGRGKLVMPLVRDLRAETYLIKLLGEREHIDYDAVLSVLAEARKHPISLTEGVL